MKKAIFFILAAALLLGLSGCSENYQEDVWYSAEKLSECLVPDLPQIGPTLLNHSDWKIFDLLTDDEFDAYVQSVYDYLKAQDFEYLGTRGHYKSSLSIAFMSYYFQPAETLAQHCQNGDYYFVYSDGSTDENGTLIFWFLGIYRYDNESRDYDGKTYKYNTELTLRKGGEAPAAGFYYYDEEHIDPCFFGHSYDEGAVYPVPGSEDTITAYTCQNCGDEDLSDWIGDMTMYKLIEADSSAIHYLKRHLETCASGLVVRIDTQKLDDADIVLSVNGTLIPKEELEDRWRYTFIMPCADAVITAELVDGFLPPENS